AEKGETILQSHRSRLLQLQEEVEKRRSDQVLEGRRTPQCPLPFSAQPDEGASYPRVGGQPRGRVATRSRPLARPVPRTPEQPQPLCQLDRKPGPAKSTAKAQVTARCCLLAEPFCLLSAPKTVETHCSGRPSSGHEVCWFSTALTRSKWRPSGGDGTWLQ